MNLVAGQGISVALTAHLNSGYLNGSLTDSAGSVLSSLSTPGYAYDGQTRTITFTVATTGVYYLNVNGTPSGGGSYDLAVYNAWFNAGVTDASRGYYATRYTASYLQNTSSIPYVIAAGDTRWLRFTATAGTALSFNLTAHLNSGSINGYLTDSAGNTLSQFSTSAGDGATRTISFTVATTGVYYLKVDGTYSGDGSFDLNGTGFNANTDTTVTSVIPASARLDVAQNFTVTGYNLSFGMGFTVEDCEPESGPGAIPEVGTGTATQRTFRCVPRLPGPKNVTVKTAPGGAVLFTSAYPVTAGAVPIMVDHPARLGNAGSRGIPTVKGVSLWNGNVHLEATDLSVPGKGVSFALTRSYNSYSWDYEKNRGGVSEAAPWRFNWDLKLGYVLNPDNTTYNTNQMWVQREDGSGENFFKDATDGFWYPMDQGNFNTIQGDTPVAGQTTLLSREGLKYVFQNPDQGGLLIKILDHNGNGLTIARNASGRVGTVTDASNRVYTFTYDANGNLFQVKDFTNRYVEYTWEIDSVGVRLKTVRDVRGGITTYNYSIPPATLVNPPVPQTLLTSIVDPVGQATGKAARTFTYTDTVYGNWGADSVMDGENYTWQFSYCARQSDLSCTHDPITATGFETTTTPPLGSTTLASFDTGGRLITQLDANSKLSKNKTMPLTMVTGKTYNLAALPTYKQSALGVTNSYGTSYAYTADNAGNLATQTDADGNTNNRTWLSGTAQATTLAAKNLYRVSQFVSAMGSQHGFTYDNAGNVLSYTPPALPAGGVATQMSYNPAGEVIGVTDGRGNASSRTYFADGSLQMETGPDTFSVQYTYDNLGRVLTTTDKRGNVTTNTWDEAGNLLSVKDAMNGLVSYVYDANGNRTQMTDALNNITQYTYDANNRLKTVAKTVGTQTLTTTYIYDALGRTTSTVNANNHADSTTYDGNGNVLIRANALTFATQYVYDADNRVTRTIDPETRITDSTYDHVGRVKSVITAAGTTSYVYDGDGRMTSSTDPRGKVTQYGYDAAGHLTTLIDAKLQPTHATYDANGNMLSVTDPNNQSTLYTYDKLNRPLTRTDANGQQWVTTYDANGNIKTLTVPGNKTTTYTYDVLDRVSRIDYPDLSYVSYTYDANGNRKTMTDSTGITHYTYDALNRMTSKTDPQGKTVSYGYDGIGNVTTLGYPDGQAVNYSYDAGERLASLTDWLNKTTTYTLNKAGQVTSALFGNNSRADMGYDTAGRMTSLINKNAFGTVISSHTMTPDANGNITSSTQQLPLQPHLTNFNRVFTYDPANRLATYNGAAVTYDPAGRITSLAGDNYSYNDRDQITAITGSQSASYEYNGEGDRVTRNINGSVIRFVIDPNQGLSDVLAETDNAGAVQRNYVFGYGLVEQIDSTNAAHYYHYDPTGSTLALTNAAGVVTDSYAYTPYGETTASGSTVNPFRYVGKLGVMDDGNGMQYMRARYYRPDVARFMSLDQLAGSTSDPQSLNRYAYVLGNPMMGVDPSGYTTEDATKTVVSYVVAASLWTSIQVSQIYAGTVSLIGTGIAAAITKDSSVITNNSFGYQDSANTAQGTLWEPSKNIGSIGGEFVFKAGVVTKDKVVTWSKEVNLVGQEVAQAYIEGNTGKMVFVLANGTYSIVGDATNVCAYAEVFKDALKVKNGILESACETIEKIKEVRKIVKEVGAAKSSNKK